MKTWTSWKVPDPVANVPSPLGGERVRVRGLAIGYWLFAEGAPIRWEREKIRRLWAKSKPLLPIKNAKFQLSLARIEIKTEADGLNSTTAKLMDFHRKFTPIRLLTSRKGRFIPTKSLGQM